MVSTTARTATWVMHPPDPSRPSRGTTVAHNVLGQQVEVVAIADGADAFVWNNAYYYHPEASGSGVLRRVPLRRLVRRCALLPAQPRE